MSHGREDQIKAVGRRIAQAREEIGLTQRELAVMMGVTERAVQAWELGESDQAARYRSLAERLNKPIAWLMFGEEAAPVGEWVNLLAEIRDLLVPMRDDIELVKRKVLNGT